MEDEMYNNDDYDKDFESIFNPTPHNILINLPVGETLAINGPRQIPTVITITNKVQKDSKRDARMLSSFLASALDEQCLLFLAQYLFSEHLAPLMPDMASAESLAKRAKRKPKPSADAFEDLRD